VRDDRPEVVRMERVLNGKPQVKNMLCGLKRFRKLQVMFVGWIVVSLGRRCSA
jgi:hypothetical protein